MAVQYGRLGGCRLQAYNCKVPLLHKCGRAGGAVRQSCAPQYTAETAGSSAHRKRTGSRNWSPPSPAVPFANHAPHQYTAETAGSMAHLERTGSQNIRLLFRFRQSVEPRCVDKV